MLPGPALLSVCAHLLADWPDTMSTVMRSTECCSAWASNLRNNAMWELVGGAAGLKPGICTSIAHYIAFRAAHSSPPWGFLAEGVLPHEVRFHFEPGQRGQVCIKRTSLPDTSWAFSERAFTASKDMLVWYAVAVDAFSDELRVGFTDSPSALLGRSRFFTYRVQTNPHVRWCRLVLVLPS